jgi:hypothetical protein
LGLQPGLGLGLGLGPWPGLGHLHAAPHERAQTWRVRLSYLEDELVVHLVSIAMGHSKYSHSKHSQSKFSQSKYSPRKIPSKMSSSCTCSRSRPVSAWWSVLPPSPPSPPSPSAGTCMHGSGPSGGRQAGCACGCRLRSVAGCGLQGVVAGRRLRARRR